ncbi:MAG TPA: ATP-binding protein, partial [Candidatus Dormibacteraeota bacterium]|nr:ATP-binding protein [Candidatus Dormibacteraeota bacterium]
MVFSEARDLPGNVMMEQAVQARMQQDTTNRIEFFSESLDAAHFSDATQQQVFKDYLRRKYIGQSIDLLMLFMARDFGLMDQVPFRIFSNAPVAFFAISEMDVPDALARRGFNGVVQRFDVEGTMRLIFRLQPDTRRVVVLSGISKTDLLVLRRIEESARSMDGIEFEFWTNKPLSQVRAILASPPEGTAVLLGGFQRDVTEQQFYTVRVAQMLAPSAGAAFYGLGGGQIGSGIVGGSVVDFEHLGAKVGQLALGILNHEPRSENSIETRTNGTVIVDWRALRRWDINPSRLPPDCVVRHQPQTLWQNHRGLILTAVGVITAQALTIAALLAQRAHRRRAEAEIQSQRADLAHAARVSTAGQMSAAMAHELNQPLGAILRNAEAAELFLNRDNPDLNEVRSILADIRKDDRRAGDVIEKLRAMLKRRGLSTNQLDLRELLKETVGLASADATVREMEISLELPESLPPVVGDRIQIQQVLLNLMINGMDAMKDSGQFERRLIVSAGVKSKDETEVSVRDFGAGISADKLARIFEPFFT